MLIEQVQGIRRSPVAWYKNICWPIASFMVPAHFIAVIGTCFYAVFRIYASAKDGNRPVKKGESFLSPGREGLRLEREPMNLVFREHGTP